ncbi:MAG: hypothetical protein ACLUN9_16320 [Enterocloster aldenensis]
MERNSSTVPGFLPLKIFFPMGLLHQRRICSALPVNAAISLDTAVAADVNSLIRLFNAGATALKIGANAVASAFFNCVKDDFNVESVALVSSEYFARLFIPSFIPLNMELNAINAVPIKSDVVSIFPNEPLALFVFLFNPKIPALIFLSLPTIPFPTIWANDKAAFWASFATFFITDISFENPLFSPLIPAITVLDESAFKLVATIEGNAFKPLSTTCNPFKEL